MVWYDYGEGRDDDDVEADEHRFTNRELLAKLFPYFKGHRRSLLLVLFLLTIGTLAALAGPQILRVVVNLAVDGDSAAITPIVLMGILFVLMTLVSITMQYWAVVVMARAGEFILTRLKVRLFRHILRLPVKFFTDYSPVDI